MNENLKSVRKVFVFAMLMSGIGLFPIEIEGGVQKINRQVHIYEEKSHENNEKKILDVPVLCQYPELPTGCESTSAAMILQYYGVHVSPEIFASEWLECEKLRKFRDGKIHGPDPAKAFAGTPFSTHAYGCYAEVIADAVNKNCRYCMAVVHKEKSLDKLCENFVSRGIPVMIWATMGMKPSRQGDKWVLEDGSVFDWIAGEHCLVLSGYTQTQYMLNDPQTGNVVFYPKELVQKRYEELGCQAIVVNKYAETRYGK